MNSAANGKQTDTQLDNLTKERKIQKYKHYYQTLRDNEQSGKWQTYSDLSKTSETGKFVELVELQRV